MAEYGLHCQLGLPPWAQRFYEVSGSRWLKVMDPGDEEPLPRMPHVNVLVRFDEPEDVAAAEVLAGAYGARQRFERVHDRFLRHRPWLAKPWYYLEHMNEPSNAGILRTKAGRLALDAFTAEYTRLLSFILGIRSVGYNLGVGHPEPEHVVQIFRQGLPALKRYRGLWGLHEYGWPDMATGDGWWTLRYRHTVKALEQAGIEYPNLVINECGVDGLLVGQARGWLSVNNNPEVHLAQLAWYLWRLRETPYVAAAFPFTTTPEASWFTYEVHEDLGMRLATWMRDNPPEVQIPPSVFDVIEACRAMPKNPDPATEWPNRDKASIKRVVIHHSVTEVPENTPEAELQHLKNIARGHIRIANWWTIGYHYCIFDSGRVWRVNPNICTTNHVGGHNSSSVGVCLIGRLHKRQPSARQLAAAAWLVHSLGWPAVPHKSLNQTACPGDWDAWGHIIMGV
jgi:hypothetical protein